MFFDLCRDGQSELADEMVRVKKNLTLDLEEIRNAFTEWKYNMEEAPNALGKKTTSCKVSIKKSFSEIL